MKLLRDIPLDIATFQRLFILQDPRLSDPNETFPFLSFFFFLR